MEAKIEVECPETEGMFSANDITSLSEEDAIRQLYLNKPVFVEFRVMTNRREANDAKGVLVAVNRGKLWVRSPMGSYHIINLENVIHLTEWIRSH